MRGRSPIVPQRRRRIPPQFSWVDHRLVRDGHVQGRTAPALALYLFLVTVADADGLSWYSEAALCRQLSCSAAELQGARTELQQAGLIASRTPLYQVLDLAPATVPPSASAPCLSAPRTRQAGAGHCRDGEPPVAIGTILHHIRGGAR
ncbi:MAG: helix-turn-helix domain-containing protein [Chloroflexota bacterium]